MVSATRVIGAVVALVVASYAAFFGWLVTSIRALRREIYTLDRETACNSPRASTRSMRNLAPNSGPFMPKSIL
jgi:hypothetical protein